MLFLAAAAAAASAVAAAVLPSRTTTGRQIMIEYEYIHSSSSF